MGLVRVIHFEVEHFVSVDLAGPSCLTAVAVSLIQHDRNVISFDAGPDRGSLPIECLICVESEFVDVETQAGLSVFDV